MKNYADFEKIKNTFMYSIPRPTILYFTKIFEKLVEKG